MAATDRVDTHQRNHLTELRNRAVEQEAEMQAEHDKIQDQITAGAARMTTLQVYITVMQENIVEIDARLALL